MALDLRHSKISGKSVMDRFEAVVKKGFSIPFVGSKGPIPLEVDITSTLNSIQLLKADIEDRLSGSWSVTNPNAVSRLSARKIYPIQKGQTKKVGFNKIDWQEFIKTYGGRMPTKDPYVEAKSTPKTTKTATQKASNNLEAKYNASQLNLFIKNKLDINSHETYLLNTVSEKIGKPVTSSGNMAGIKKAFVKWLKDTNETRLNVKTFDIEIVKEIFNNYAKNITEQNLSLYNLKLKTKGTGVTTTVPRVKSSRVKVSELHKLVFGYGASKGLESLSGKNLQKRLEKIAKKSETLTDEMKKAIKKAEERLEESEDNEGNNSTSARLTDAFHAYALGYAWKKGSDITIKDLNNIEENSLVVSLVTLDECIKVKSNKKWAKSTVLTTNLIRKKYTTGYTVYHDEDVSWIYKKAFEFIRKENIQGLNTGNKKTLDKWQPADIWLIKTNSLQSIKSKINDTKSLSDLNQTLLEMFNKNLLIGISLKQAINNSIRLEAINKDKDRVRVEYDLEIGDLFTSNKNRLFGSKVKSIGFKGYDKNLRFGQSGSSITSLEVYYNSGTKANTSSAHGAYNLEAASKHYGLILPDFDGFERLAGIIAYDLPDKNSRAVQGFVKLLQNYIPNMTFERLAEEYANAKIGFDFKDAIYSILIVDHYIIQKDSKKILNEILNICMSTAKESCVHYKVT